MTAKKILSIILALAMIFSVTSVAASAAETIIEPFKPVTVTASAENNPVFKFVPEETKSYIVKSFAPDDVDPYCIIDSGFNSFMIDDSAGLTNFAEKYEFEAGVEYYLTIYTYSDDDTTFDVVLECAHEWVDDTCTECTKVCDHETESTRFNTCLCGKVSDAYNITLGETVTVPYVVDPYVVRFVPEEDVTAIISSNVYSEETPYDVFASLYDVTGTLVGFNDDFGGSYDFLIWYEFKAGETYFLIVETFYPETGIEFSLRNAVHTADDGSEHPVIYEEETYGTCIELAYTNALYCEECGEYVAGHVENGYGVCEDYDCDDICDHCGEPIVYDEPEDDIPEDDDTEIPEDEGFFSGIIGKIIEFIKNIINFLMTVFGNILN